MSDYARVINIEEPAELIYLLGINPKDIALTDKDDRGFDLLQSLNNGDTLSLELSSGKRVVVLVTDLVRDRNIIAKGVVQS
jgi:hypothetical protein